MTGADGMTALAARARAAMAAASPRNCDPIKSRVAAWDCTWLGSTRFVYACGPGMGLSGGLGADGAGRDERERCLEGVRFFAKA